MPSREPELYKDKIEVSLDSRQIFYLFFGGAVIVGVVFVLGVLVGRRVEARGHIERAATHAEADPLAALDRLEGNGGLSFQGALTGKQAGKQAASDVERTISEIEKARKAAPPSVVELPERAPPRPPTPAVDEAKPVAQPAVKPPELVPAPAVQPDAKPAAGAVKPVMPPSIDPKQGAALELKSESRYTLQLSAFQDKAEAEAYLSSIKTSLGNPYIMRADVDGKGTWYRIRIGSYGTLEAANVAKADFEKSSKQQANVIKL